ncbi:MAG TPA: hypothetical protein VNK04_13140 [Gemmataceae bacterium]|nr:hypothetical protein [Gemmataceae bacterium]
MPTGRSSFTLSPCHLVALSVLILGWLAGVVRAHPVDLGIYERTIDVCLTAEGVTVAYRLELSQQTAVKDLLAVIEGGELARLTRPRDYYEAFTRLYAPILAANLTAQLDGKDLTFTCTRHSHQVLDHLLCDFLFQARWDLRPGRRYEFTFREDNYDREAGLVRLSLGNDPSAPLVRKSEPDEALKGRSATELKPGDEDRMRRASAMFEVVTLPAKGAADAAGGPVALLRPAAGETDAGPKGWFKPESAPPPAEARAAPSVPEPAAPTAWSEDEGLLRLFLDSERGFWMMLLLAAGLGAAHALTPGHGKTLVAAYLVGQRGTVWHALVLGLVTTLTHTGVVLVLALVLWLYFPHDSSAAMRRDVETVLGLVSGLLIVGLGVWLLLRRLSGQADHFHLGGHGPHHHHGHHHHHDHGHADHYHDEHGHAHPLPARAGIWGLIILGTQGGILPCWDAVVLLMVAVAKNLLWLALPLLLAFSAGLAAVLIAIGILVVQARGLAGARWDESRLFKALPVLSAILITAVGLWLCYDTVQTRMAPVPPVIHSSR